MSLLAVFITAALLANGYLLYRAFRQDQESCAEHGINAFLNDMGK